MLEGGVAVLQLTRSTPGGCSSHGGGLGGRVVFFWWGGMRRIFEVSEPKWETGDDQAKLERRIQRVATSSPLDISMVVTPGACTIRCYSFMD